MNSQTCIIVLMWVLGFFLIISQIVLLTMFPPLPKTEANVSLFLSYVVSITLLCIGYIIIRLAFYRQNMFEDIFNFNGTTNLNNVIGYIIIVLVPLCIGITIIHAQSMHAIFTNWSEPAFYAPTIIYLVTIAPQIVMLVVLAVYYLLHFLIAIILKLICIEPISSQMFELEYTIFDLLQDCFSYLCVCSCKPCLVGIAACINKLYPDSTKPNDPNENQPILANAPAYYSNV